MFFDKKLKISRSINCYNQQEQANLNLDYT